MSLEYAARHTSRDVDVTFTVERGQTVALVGANGAGKSTVLATTTGLLRPDAGVVRLDGRTLLDTTAGTDVAPHRRNVALLAQDPLLFPHLDVAANVAFGPRSRGLSRAAAGERASYWLEAVGAADLADRRPDALSGGQAQRIAIARALAAEPELLLLDEPMASLDVAVAPELRQMLRRVLAERTTVLVTHDVLDALLLADRVVVLDRGRVVEDGPTAEVLSRPRSAFAADLAGLNLLLGTWSGEHVDLTDGGLVHGLASEPRPAVGAAVVATFRPSAVAVYRSAPEGSPRNAFRTRVTEVEPLGDRVRVRCGSLSADVTLQAVAELDLAPGVEVMLSVKATEVAVYERG